ncbi:MAG: glycosyltransferase family 88 protein [Legionellales bacterium]
MANLQRKHNFFSLSRPPITFWSALMFTLTLPVLLPRWILSFLLARNITNLALNPTQVKKQKPINLIYLSDDSDESETVVVNVLPHEPNKTLRDYLLKFNSAVMTLPFLAGIKRHRLCYDHPEDRAYVDQVIDEIDLLLQGKSVADKCSGKKFTWDNIHLKGCEGLDNNLYAYFCEKLYKKYGEAEVTQASNVKLNFFTLETSDSSVLDSVEVSAADEEKKPMSERKFVVACMVRDQNYLSWIKDFNATAQKIACTVIGFNYRGICYSKGMVWTQNNMIDDVLAQVDRLLELGAKPENIGLEGQCLGGAVATIAAASLHERGLKVKLYNERSFRSLPRFVTGLILPGLNSNPWNPLNWLRYLAAGIVYLTLGPLIWFCGWRLDAASAWDKIPYADKDYSVVRGHKPDTQQQEEDGIIEDQWASMASLVDEQQQRLAEQEPTTNNIHQHMVHGFKMKFQQLSQQFQKKVTTEKTLLAMPSLEQNYKYNPHQHVKIWLSNKPSVFMNIENQIRLIDMREKNPTDVIHLIYDSSLLNEQGMTELQHFCKEHAILPVDAANEFNHALQTEKEQKLYEFYQDEITHLKDGGNLAVASDIMRWLSPVYTRGTYTDFDVPVDTRNLPPLVYVDAPLLLNIGSLQIRNKEVILSNNDYIAIVDPTAAQKEIELVQDGFIKVLGEYTNDFIEKTTAKIGDDSFINRYIIGFMKNRSESVYIERSKSIAAEGVKLSSRKLRAYIHDIMSDQNKFVDFNKADPTGTRAAEIQRIRTELRQQLSTIKWLFFSKEYNEISQMLRQTDEVLLSQLMKKECSLYVKSIVVCTTGPISIANCLFHDYVFDHQVFNQDVRRFSFNHYDLRTAFQSKNAIPMYENILGMMKFLGAEDGKLNDSSWLEEGANLQAARGELLVLRKQALCLSLPAVFAGLKQDLKNHIQTLEDNSKGFYGLFLQERKQEKLVLLNAALACFKEEPASVFDIREFGSLLTQVAENKSDVYAGLFQHQTQDLIEKLAKNCQEAVVFGLTTNRKLSLMAIEEVAPVVVPDAATCTAPAKLDATTAGDVKTPQVAGSPVAVMDAKKNQTSLFDGNQSTVKTFFRAAAPRESGCVRSQRPVFS